ncbi:MAG: NAD-dependent epimerase/dehydratase family protein [Planctomycetota bacterium]
MARVERVLVTGGGGFLGSHVVRALLAAGLAVRSFSRGHYPELVAAGVDAAQGDLADPRAVTDAAAGCDAVIHTAALAGIWGAANDYEQANVVGTENVLAACRTHGIEAMVYTSSPSVVFAGVDQENIDESAPYPSRFLGHYPRTKAAAEQRVLAANGPRLATVALRPHLIWGPRDSHLVPSVVARARSGALRLIHPEKRVDCCYVDNAAAAHLLALDRLAVGSAIAGRAFFISQGEPIAIGEFVNRILAAAGLPPVARTIPAGVAYAVGAVLETAYGLLRIQREPRMTRFLARQLATAHWFDLTAAYRDLGYVPRVSIDEGMRRLREWFMRSHPVGREAP